MGHGYGTPNIDERRHDPLTDILQCEIRPSHASYKYIEGAPPLPKAMKKERWQKGCMVKGRNEPVAISRVAQVIAQIKNIPIEEVCEA